MDSAIGAEYLVGIDGLSLLLVLLTSIVVPFALLAQRMGRGFCALMLVTQSALYGTFTAQNFVLWFLFFEMSLIPSFLLIKALGRRRARSRCDEVLRLHVPRERRDAAVVPRDLPGARHFRFRRARRDGAETAC
jgi:NADH:ubiquinone oxidoreductase subunit 5 (subunit L)/multisubunit Na+/H+ antiporter MnhA subunit